MMKLCGLNLSQAPAVSFTGTGQGSRVQLQVWEVHTAHSAALDIDEGFIGVVLLLQVAGISTLWSSLSQLCT